MSSWYCVVRTAFTRSHSRQPVASIQPAAEPPPHRPLAHRRRVQNPFGHFLPLLLAILSLVVVVVAAAVHLRGFHRAAQVGARAVLGARRVLQRVPRVRHRRLDRRVEGAERGEPRGAAADLGLRLEARAHPVDPSVPRLVVRTQVEVEPRWSPPS